MCIRDRLGGCVRRNMKLGFNTVVKQRSPPVAVGSWVQGAVTFTDMLNSMFFLNFHIPIDHFDVRPCQRTSFFFFLANYDEKLHSERYEKLHSESEKGMHSI